MFHHMVLVWHLSNTCTWKETAFRLKSKVIILRWWQACLKMTLDFNVAQVNFGVWKDLWEDNTEPIYTQLKCVFPSESAPIPSLLPEGPGLKSVWGVVEEGVVSEHFSYNCEMRPQHNCFPCASVLARQASMSPQRWYTVIKKIKRRKLNE